MGLVFNYRFFAYFSIKISLIKNPIIWPSFNIWREWPSGLKHYNKNCKVPNWNPSWHSAGFFINCYLVVPQPTLGHSQRDSLTNQMFMKMFSTITTKPHYKAPGDLRVKILTMQWLTIVYNPPFLLWQRGGLSLLPNFQKKWRAGQDLNFERGVTGKEGVTFFRGRVQFLQKKLKS